MIPICICIHFTLPLCTSATKFQWKKKACFFLLFQFDFFFLLRSGCWILWFYADVGFYAENQTAIWSVKNISRIEIDLSAVLHILDKQVAGTFSVFLQENSFFFFFCLVNIGDHVEIGLLFGWLKITCICEILFLGKSKIQWNWNRKKKHLKSAFNMFLCVISQVISKSCRNKHCFIGFNGLNCTAKIHFSQ